MNLKDLLAKIKDMTLKVVNLNIYVLLKFLNLV